MTFANVSVNHDELTLLSQLLITAFPGCTIHQSRDPERAARHLSFKDVDAVFADADIYSELKHILDKQKSNVSVYLLCRQEMMPSDMTEIIQGIITYPLTKQKIKNALQTVPRELMEVV